ncbi:hypothetical protein SAY87_008859 [Trapa incisa]|uniref:Uncharacterized protein n=1 Tax=Trapa incisa TaxID=236973 RepID=A0AAN7PVS2_9MYRT|nr:hypothetical protein SAY87_008859 [Trapa incisa]
MIITRLVSMRPDVPLSFSMAISINLLSARENLLVWYKITMIYRNPLSPGAMSVYELFCCSVAEQRPVAGSTSSAQTSTTKITMSFLGNG